MLFTDISSIIKMLASMFQEPSWMKYETVIHAENFQRNRLQLYRGRAFSLGRFPLVIGKKKKC